MGQTATPSALKRLLEQEELRQQLRLDPLAGLVAGPQPVAERFDDVIRRDGDVSGAAVHHAEDGTNHATDRGDLRAARIPGRGQRVVVAEQLVGAVDEVNVHGRGPVWSKVYRVKTLVPILVLTTGLATVAVEPPQPGRVAIRVDTARRVGPMTPIWAWFGYDEPNYTYAPGGRQLLSELAALSPVPVYVRTHNLLTSGDGTASLKWGSTNAYREDASGRPIYDWTIVDRILSTYVERGMKPLVEIGFMPEALSSHPSPYRHAWKPGGQAELFTGWSYPPTDYDKWRQLVYEWVRHSVEKYGRAAVESWWWEVWNEPDIGYRHGTVEEYQKLYDYAADGLKRALPTARIGGPHVTGPNGPRPQQFLKAFLEHCLHGTNYATGKPGSPLDYVGFHAKGAPRVAPEGFVRMSVRNQLQAIDNAFGIVGSFPELSRVPIVIGESDPEGCAACPMSTNPSNAYRNGTMYSSYTAEQLARTYELTDRHHVNLIGAVTWAFEFEEQPYFAGFRDLSTNGIDKPVLNVFRMLGRMKGDRVRAEGETRSRSMRFSSTGSWTRPTSAPWPRQTRIPCPC